MLRREDLEGLDVNMKLRKCSRAGMTKAQTADLLGVSRAYITQAARTHEVPFPDGRARMWSEERRRALSEQTKRRLAGVTRT